MSGPAIRCGADPGKSPRNSMQFPYPATENWQKAIGAHWIWLSGSVEVFTNPQIGRPSTFRAVMDLHAEDRYNFNPGDADLATGVTDSENGRFEVTRLGHAYQSQATLRRLFSWTGLKLGVSIDAVGGSPLTRQPDNNRRARNRRATHLTAERRTIRSGRACFCVPAQSQTTRQRELRLRRPDRSFRSSSLCVRVLRTSHATAEAHLGMGSPRT